MRSVLFSTAILSIACGGCELLDDVTGDGGVLDRAPACSTVCSKVNECGNKVNPPAAQSIFGKGETGNDTVDCAVTCVDPEGAVKHGYSDCQIRCLKAASTSCDEMNDCWKTRSELYKQYCGKRENKPIDIDNGDDEVDNGSSSGNTEADEILDDDAVNGAVDDSDTHIYGGDTPPEISGLYTVIGAIDKSENARPRGNPIETSICFWGMSTNLAGGPEIHYCENGVYGTASAPITGNSDKFTIYLDNYSGGATILFSGKASDGGKKVSDAEALVVYTFGTDIWEHSVTQWQRTGSCSGCE